MNLRAEMTCKCGKKPLKGLDWCKKCFLRIFEKRIRSELHNYPWFEKKEKVTILDDKTCKTDILKHLILPLLEVARIEVRVSKKKPRTGRIISCDNLEDFVLEFLDSVLQNKDWKKEKIVCPLKQLTDDEINKYAEIKGFKPFGRYKTVVLGFIQDLEKRHSETKFALLRSAEKLKTV